MAHSLKQRILGRAKGISLRFSPGASRPRSAAARHSPRCGTWIRMQRGGCKPFSGAAARTRHGFEDPVGRQKRKDAPVPENKVISLEERAKDEQKPFLEQLLREGARKLLQAAIENEVLDYIQLHKDRLDENGQRLVVRNGHLPEREVVSGVGPIPVRQPRVRHRDQGRFTSAILPKYMRRAPSIDALIPALYLKGISTGDFSEALSAILGEGASGLSATNIVRLKSSWETDYKEWSQRDLSAKRYVYWWADGVYFNVRL